MVPLSKLTERLSNGLSLPRQRVDLVARRMREAEALPTGTSGRHETCKAHIAPEDAVKLLLALVSDCPATEAADMADSLAGLPIMDFVAIYPDGAAERIGSDSPGWQNLVQSSGDTLGEVLTAHLVSLAHDTACAGEIESLVLNSQFPTAYISALCKGFRFCVVFSRLRQLSNDTLQAAMSRQTVCGGAIFPYLARTYREDLRAADQHLESGAPANG